ncbi:unnamed protein product [Acanthosepion pharaonis]|uniref:Uncharacterized protein n=1 Tax=Acanthosepion pharaonis TaxID=158019 RepID=A0A812EHY9_ACAPH|nr:unnamed protein product [Sepia pharaonis]
MCVIFIINSLPTVRHGTRYAYQVLPLISFHFPLIFQLSHYLSLKLSYLYSSYILFPPISLFNVLLSSSSLNSQPAPLLFFFLFSLASSTLSVFFFFSLARSTLSIFLSLSAWLDLLTVFFFFSICLGLPALIFFFFSSGPCLPTTCLFLFFFPPPSLARTTHCFFFYLAGFNHPIFFLLGWIYQLTPHLTRSTSIQSSHCFFLLCLLLSHSFSLASLQFWTITSWLLLHFLSSLILTLCLLLLTLFNSLFVHYYIFPLCLLTFPLSFLCIRPLFIQSFYILLAVLFVFVVSPLLLTLCPLFITHSLSPHSFLTLCSPTFLPCLFILSFCYIMIVFPSLILFL